MEWLTKRFRKDPNRPVFIQVATIRTESTDSCDPSASEEPESNINATRGCSGLLIKHFRFLFYLGICPFRIEEGATSWDTANKVRFWVLSLLSLIHTLDGVKYFGGFLTKGDLEQLLLIGYFVIRGLIKLTFVTIVIRNWQKLRGVLIRAAQLEKIIPNFTILSVCIAAAVLIMTISQTLFGSLSIQEWTPRGAILVRSIESSYSVFLWRKQTINNGTFIEALNQKYGASLSTATILLGGGGLLVDFCGYLQLYAIWYFVFAMSIFLGALTEDFIDQLPSVQAWEYFSKLQENCREMDDVVGTLLKLLHINNTMVVARFLLLIFLKAENSIFSAMAFLDTLLVMTTYVLASRLSNKNKDMKLYVMEHSSDKQFIDIGTSRVPVTYIIHSLDLKPLGLGSDNFLIDESFILKFLCIVGSYFLFIEQRQRGN